MANFKIQKSCICIYIHFPTQYFVFVFKYIFLHSILYLYLNTFLCICAHLLLSVMNLVTTHYNCTSPIDYISHHALHTHIPVHHYTNHTAVTIHSLVLIASPHLHLILTLTFKQHSHLHSLRSLVSPWLHFRAYFSVCLSVHYLDCWPPLLIVCCLPLWPRLFHGNPLCLPPALTHCSVSVFDSAFSTLPSTPLPDICLFWPCTNKAASGSTLASDLSSVTLSVRFRVGFGVGHISNMIEH